MDATLKDSLDYLPYGEQIAGATSTTHKFTGKERDTESGLDYFGARYYSSGLGRFMRPDGPFLDQYSTDPQSWNLYTYVRNNPIRNVDPNGEACRVDGSGNRYDDDNEGESCAEIDDIDGDHGQKASPVKIVQAQYTDEEYVNELSYRIAGMTSPSSLAQVGKEAGSNIDFGVAKLFDCSFWRRCSFYLCPRGTPVF